MAATACSDGRKCIKEVFRNEKSRQVLESDATSWGIFVSIRRRYSNIFCAVTTLKSNFRVFTMSIYM
jgi:hypothetical protein